MEPVSPVMPGSQPIEKVYGEQQQEYIPLPAVYLNTEEKIWKVWAGHTRLAEVVAIKRPSQPVLSRWRLTDEERKAIAEGADVVLTLLTFGTPLAPSHLQVVKPDEMPLLVEEP